MSEDPTGTPNAPAPDDSKKLLDLAQLHHEAGKLEDAQTLYQLVLETDPDNPVAYHGLGLLALQIGQYDTARDLIQMAIARDDRQAPFHRSLADAYRGLQNNDSAITCYQRALALAPDDRETQLQLGLSLMLANRWQEAATHLDRAIVLGSVTATAFAALAQCQLELAHYDEATRMAIAAVKLDAENLQGLRALAKAWFAVGQYKNAYDAGEHLVAKSNDNIEDILLLARLYADSAQPPRALELSEQALALDPKNVAAMQVYAGAHIMQGHWDVAMEVIDRALQETPDNPIFTNMKVSILERKGDHEQAYKLIKPFIRKANANVSSIWLFAKLAKRFGEQALAQELLENHLAKDSIPFSTKPDTLSLLGTIYDDQGDYDKAFTAFAEANAIKPHYYVDKTHEAFINRIIEHFNPARLQHLPVAPQDSERPIFIVGMPRSGTSLTEKILTRHPEVSAGGELNHIKFLAFHELPRLLGKEKPFPEYLDEINEDILSQAAQFYLDQIDALEPSKALRVTDKMPMNFTYLGLIYLLFPRAKIINCTRNPLATGLSCFIVNFQSVEEMGFSQDLETIGRYYKRYERLMKHWHEVLPCPIHDLSYEALVSDPETEIRKLLEFCGLPWHDDCLTPHESSEVVKTASYNQVRQPINTQSIDRWKRYDTHLQPLRDELDRTEQ